MTATWPWRGHTVVLLLVLSLLLGVPAPAGSGLQAKPIIVGLDADMSSGSAQGGEAIRRGILLAIDEVNAAGGVLGRPFELRVRDHRGNPARGIDNIEEFAAMDDLVAVVGGIHTPVAMAELESIHKHEILYLGPWAAGTPIVDNPYNPNFVFRISVRDEHAGGFLIDAALERGFRKPGLLLWRTSWGRSNQTAMQDWLVRLGREPAPVQWFNSGQEDLSEQIDALVALGTDVVMLVANPVDGLALVRTMAARPEEHRLPIISHWGITGGDWHKGAAAALARIDLTFLQTYSFVAPPIADRGERFYHAYCAKFSDCRGPADVISPVGTAHAYDLIHLLVMAIDKAGTTERAKVRTAMERLGHYEGVMRDYDPPFTAERHDALDASDFRLSRYDENGGIRPATR